MDFCAYENDEEWDGMASQRSAKQRSDSIAARANVISCVSVFIVLIGVAWPIYRDIHGDNKLDKRLIGIETSIASLKASVRVLAAATAPQMQKAIDDSLSDNSGESSSLRLKERLNQAALTVKTLTNNGVAESPVQAKDRAQGVSKILDKYPTSDIAWSAASDFINYASASRVLFATQDYPECFAKGMQSYSPHPESFSTRRMLVAVTHCTLYLDQQKLFENSDFGARYNKEVSDGVTDQLDLYLTDVHLVYDGGTLLKFSRLVCQGCTFDVYLPSVPSTKGQSLTRSLLAATDGNVNHFDIGS
jgi:hypothetical protein